MTTTDRPRTEGRPDSLFGIPNLGRATLVGAAAGLLVVIAVMGLAVALTDLPATYLAAAVHAGLFGGAGFGAMLAAVTQATKHEAAGAQTTSPRPPIVTTTTHPTIDLREKEPA